MNAEMQLTVPAGEVLIRKVRGSEGFHERAGYAKIGRIYTVGDRWATRMVEGGEFEYVYPPKINVELSADNQAEGAFAAAAKSVQAVVDASSSNGKAPSTKTPGK